MQIDDFWCSTSKWVAVGSKKTRLGSHDLWISCTVAYVFHRMQGLVRLSKILQGAKFQLTALNKITTHRIEYCCSKPPNFLGPTGVFFVHMGMGQSKEWVGDTHFEDTRFWTTTSTSLLLQAGGHFHAGCSLRRCSLVGLSRVGSRVLGQTCDGFRLFGVYVVFAVVWFFWTGPQLRRSIFHKATALRTNVMFVWFYVNLGSIPD